MIVRSIRLKNIKSFGEGPDGDGVTVAFEPGVNRIAGRNGSGKTTLIESLGYALFLTSPQYEDGVKIGAYFSRHGKKAGEIDVTFEFNGEVYRIECGVGSANKRKEKVIKVSDSSTCAEGNKEVAGFLCKLFDFPSSTQFSELFSKLIGVRQGRLTWPFDSKHAAARNYFQPLLDVDIFRQCYKDLGAPLKIVAEFQHAQEVKLAGVTERIADRSDSEAAVAEKCGDVEKIAAKLKTETTALEKSRKLKEALELKEAAVRKAELSHEKATSAAESATERVEAAEKQMIESKQAAKIVESTKAGYTLFLATEKALEGLRKQQTEQAALEKQKSSEENQLTKFAGEAKAAGEQAATFASQKKKKTAELETTGKTLEPLETALADLTESFANAESANLKLQENSQDLKPFTNGLADFLAKREIEFARISELNRELKDWDPEKFKAAVAAEKDAKTDVEKIRELTTKTTERQKNLSEQLAQISGGLCPFLKETCQQFDPKKVAGNVDELTAEISELEKKLTAAVATHEKAAATRENLAGQEKQLSVKQSNLDERLADFTESVAAILPESVAKAAGEISKAVPEIKSFPTPPVAESKLKSVDAVAEIQKQVVEFSESVTAWRNAASPKVKVALVAFETEKSKRQTDSEAVIHLKSSQEKLIVEVSSLTEKEQEQIVLQKTGGEKVETVKAAISDLESKLKSFSAVAESIAEQDRLLRDNRENHEAFLTATPQATKLSEREKSLKTHLENQKSAVADLKKLATELETARAEFDPEKLAEAREKYEAIGSAVASAKADLKHAEEALKREEARFKEWKKAQEKQGVIEQELERLNAAAELGQLARRVLRDSAPAVAQHLCNRIADRAQVIFNSINQAPAELKWDSESYGLRITPGERRFAMLSGGEQTKLALAMTLSMTREFSHLKFCIFDEPTYGVDAESRPLLANAVLEAQEAAGLEQLLLVSHDDAFEGKIEHAILLEKSSEGSRVALMQ